MDFACILKNGRKRDLELAKTSLELVEISKLFKRYNMNLGIFL